MSFLFLRLLLPFGVVDFFLWWLMDRVIRRNQLGASYRLLNAVWCALMAGGIGFIFNRPNFWGGSTWEILFVATVYLWHMVVVPLLLLAFLLIGFGQYLAWLIRGPVGREETRGPWEATSRRRFLRGLLAIPPVLATAGAGVSCFQLNDFRIRRLEIKFPQLPKALDGFTITQVSDTHVGLFTYGNILDRVAEATNQLGSDLVVMTGDLINYSLKSLPMGIDFLRKLRAPHGVYLCEGNHDLIQNGPEFRNRVKAAGLKLLVDEGVTLVHRGCPIRLMGTHWTGDLNGSKDLGNQAQIYIDLICRGLEPLTLPGAFQIVLTHHPHAWDSAQRAGIDLTLSGHTHGGQIMFDDHWGFGPWLFRYWSGLYRRGDRVLVVANGVGNWFPLRIHAPAEIVHLTLRAG